MTVTGFEVAELSPALTFTVMLLLPEVPAVGTLNEDDVAPETGEPSTIHW